MVLLCLAAGCGWLRVTPEALGVPSESRLAGLHDDLEEAGTPRERREVVAAWLATSGLTPLAGGAAPLDERVYRLVGADTVLGGFVPGRHPVVRSELVDVQVAWDEPGAAAVLEAARVLAERSQTRNLPGRTVLVLITPDSPARPRARWLWTESQVAVRVDAVGAGIDGVVYRVRGPAGDSVRQVRLPGAPRSVEHVSALVHLLTALSMPSDSLGAGPEPAGAR